MENRRVLVIQTAFLGDAILTLPMIQKLNELLPDSLIDVVCIPSSEEIFQSSPFVNNIIVYDKRGKHKSLMNVFRLAYKIKKNGYERIYAPHRSFRTALLVLLSGVKETYCFDKASFSFVFKHKIKYRVNYHEVQRNLELIGVNVDKVSWKILPTVQSQPNLKEKVESLISNIPNKKLIAVAPGSVWATKRYVKEYFLEVVNYLINKSYTIILIGGLRDRDLCLEVKNNFSNSVYTVAGDLSIIESIELLKYCKVLISNDSAPTHLGMCADIPTFTIYCSTVPSFGFYPYNEKSMWISYDNLECKPCGIHGFKKCPIKTFDCAYKLKPEFVIGKLENMLR